MFLIIKKTNGEVDLMVISETQIAKDSEQASIAKLLELAKAEPPDADAIAQVDVDFKASLMPEAMAAQELQKWKDNPTNAGLYASSQIVTEDQFQDFAYFRAWTWDGKAIGVDMTRARNVQRDNLRTMRIPLFAPLERKQRSALSSGDAKGAADAEAKLQALRDVTKHPSIEAAQTTDELRKAGVDVLK